MLPETCVALRRSYVDAEAKLDEIMKGIRDSVHGPHDEICVFAVGSYGRKEAHFGVSDFEWMTIYDGSRVGSAESTVFQAQLTSYFAGLFGRDKLSLNKTFGEIAELHELCTNVGGDNDTNRALTYRMLILCEGQLVNQSGAYGALIAKLADTYGRSHTAGHRLLSLATDIARYWRTLRIDYKHKVDERRKPWAVRALKLRSARRLAYFSSALHHIAFGPRIDRDKRGSFDLRVVEKFMSDMAGNSVDRLVRAAEKIQVDQERLQKLLLTYNEIHELIGTASVRDDLEKLDAEGRFDNANFVRIREGCILMHQLEAQIIVELPLRYRLEMIEMFLL